MQTSPRLGLSYIQPSQAQKHVTANETFRRLDALAQLCVKSRATAVQPAAPAEGDAYILPAGASGAAWTGLAAGRLAAFQDGAWTDIGPGKGWRAYVEDEGGFHVFDGVQWRPEAALGAEAVFSKITVRAAALLQNNFVSDGNYQVFVLDTYSSGASWHSPYLQSRRARGTEAAPAAVANGDAVFNFDMFGYDGSAFVRLGQFGFGVGGAVSTGVVPGALSFKLADTAGVLNTVLSLTPAGNTGFGVTSPTARVHVDGAVRVKSFAKAALPSAAGQGAGAILYVSDEAGGAVLAFSDGTNWRRVTDRAVVS
jgi:hypothetical protein